MNAASAKPTRVICVGLSALDHIWQAERLPGADLSKTRAESFATRGGGMAATAAVTVAKLGGDARFWGRAGDDPAGHVMRDQMAGEGVDTRWFRLFEQARSSVSGVFVDRAGERHIVNFRGGDMPEDAGWLPLSDIREAGCVLADPRWPEGAVAAFDAARKAGVATVLDGDVADTQVFERILPFTDHAIFSEPALRALAGSRTSDALEAIEARFGCTVVAVTLGGEGVAWRCKGTEMRLPAHEVAVVDTNGAGDVFHGAYALAVANGMQVAEAMRFASAAAALKCTRPDGRSAIPTFDEVIQFQRKHS
ncbi:sugar kinase [Pararhizobium mangrovi]|uniref:sugar kinase n=1 Tax=Pararhizobium mangrovi TaxID=2590452 RepID=UPI001F315D83|nr:sugar kinase [Pararhizobium mangrovi]